MDYFRVKSGGWVYREVFRPLCLTLSRRDERSASRVCFIEAQGTT